MAGKVGKAARAERETLYKNPLPVSVKPLPNVIPHNPLSVLHFLYAYLSNPSPRKHIHARFTDFGGGVVLVKVVKQEDMDFLWRNGFFGKGSLSRSEPTWANRTLSKWLNGNGRYAEDVTKDRRNTRRKFKEERARTQELAEQEELARSKEAPEPQPKPLSKPLEKGDYAGDLGEATAKEEFSSKLSENANAEEDSAANADAELPPHFFDSKGELLPLEYLQLMPCEVIFLNHGLNALSVYDDNGLKLANTVLVHHFAKDRNQHIKPDNRFILEYVAYHHYRSKGWCVRSGVKFATDFVLYQRGPPFSHAEFCVIVIPHYSDEAKNKAIAKEWWEVSNTNRVVGGVKKTLVLCYVTVPDSVKMHYFESDKGLKKLWSKYEVREVVYRRWVPAKLRD